MMIDKVKALFAGSAALALVSTVATAVDAESAQAETYAVLVRQLTASRAFRRT